MYIKQLHGWESITLRLFAYYVPVFVFQQTLLILWLDLKGNKQNLACRRLLGVSNDTVEFENVDSMKQPDWTALDWKRHCWCFLDWRFHNWKCGSWHSLASINCVQQNCEIPSILEIFLIWLCPAIISGWYSGYIEIRLIHVRTCFIEWERVETKSL